MQPLDGHRLSDLQRPGQVRLGGARRQLQGVRRAGLRTGDVDDAGWATRRHLHVLLPGPPLHARQLPDRQVTLPVA